MFDPRPNLRLLPVAGFLCQFAGKPTSRHREHTEIFAVQFSMKKTLKLSRLVFPSTLAVAMLLTGCAAEKSTDKALADAKKSAATAIPIYESTEEIKAMPSCKATIEHTAACSSRFRTADGKKFCIGSPGATREVGYFLRTLKDGKTYKFPNAFLDYQKKQK